MAAPSSPNLLHNGQSTFVVASAIPPTWRRRRAGSVSPIVSYRCCQSGVLAAPKRARFEARVGRPFGLTGRNALNRQTSTSVGVSPFVSFLFNGIENAAGLTRAF